MKTSMVLTLVAIVIMFFSFLTSTTATRPYDPWCDINDDGKIDIKDVAGVASRYGTYGDAITKASINYTSGWIDITDKAGQYFNITHNLNSTDIIVDIQGKTTLDGGVHQRHLGLTSYMPGWSRTFGGTNNDNLGFPVRTSDGGYTLAGSTDFFGAGGWDFWLVKMDSAGNMQWNKTYGGANDDNLAGMVQTSDGGYGLFGTTKSLGDTTGDFWLVKVDQFGNEQWNKTYSKAPRWDKARSFAYTSDGGFMLTGNVEYFGSPWSQIWLVKTNSTGDVEWDYTYGQNVGLISTYMGSVIEASDGGYVVASRRFPNPTYHSVWLFKTDENGTMVWHKTYGTTNHHDGGNDLVETPDGGYAIAGRTESYGAGGKDFWLIKTNSTGDKEWDKTYGGTSDDVPTSLARTSDGGYTLVGYTYSFGAGGRDFWLVKTDSAGNMQWNKTYGGANDDSAGSVVQMSDGGYVIAGSTYSFGAGGSDFWLVKTEIESGLAWTDSTADTITLYRGATDAYWNYVRVRIWEIKENP